SSASTTDGASLQQRRPFSRRRRARQFVSATIGLEDFEILLESLPTDIAGMSIRNASEPIIVFALSLDLLLAIESSPILPAPVYIGARVSWIVQHAHRRRCGQRPKDGRIANAESRWKSNAVFPKHFNRLTCRADARERFEEVRDRFPDLRVGVEHNITSVVVDKARGQGTTILAASHLIEDSTAQPSFEDVKFRLAHGSFKAEQEPIVEARWI